MIYFETLNIVKYEAIVKGNNVITFLFIRKIIKRLIINV